MRRHDTYSPLRNGTAKQFKFCNRYAVDEYAVLHDKVRLDGMSLLAEAEAKRQHAAKLESDPVDSN
jgi:hypothetical protein